MMKIVFTGPESTGKSTLCNQIANHFQLPIVDEFAREYIDKLGRNYNQSDLLKIAEGQLDLESIIKSQQPKILLCDTDLLTIKIWSEFKYGICSTEIISKLNKNLPDYYLLCSPDIEWQPDEQRESKNDREKLFTIYHEEIIRLKIPFDIITGEGDDRFKMVKDLILF